MELTDSRRLTGANFFMDRPGAVAEVELPEEQKDQALQAWEKSTRQLLDAIGWQGQQIVVRPYPGGASLMISAPIDALYAATEIIELAWDATVLQLKGDTPVDIDTLSQNLSTVITEERNDYLTALAAAAREHNVTFLGDDETVSVGLGVGGRSWPIEDIPPGQKVDWTNVYDVPVAMVTGTNGKSTTVRLAAAIGAAAGHIVGLSSSDWVRVGQEIIDEGDYSGPVGARLAARDPRVEMVVIEAARGGLMRRGMPIPQADACLITNVAADHIGDYGITDVCALADAKFLLARAVKPDGRLVLNGDDPALVKRAANFAGDITWYGLALDEQVLDAWLTDGGHAAFVRDGVMTLAKGREQIRVLPVTDFAPALGGAAKYNISNALGAIGLASALGLGVAAMTTGLSSFKGTPDENPGRGNFVEIGGVKILVDFAHNPHSMAALTEAVGNIPAKRRLFLLGQAGDRSDEDIRELTKIVWQTQPDRYIVKEIEGLSRGRAPGEVQALIVNELHALGTPRAAVATADSEIDSVIDALNWAQAGDFLVLLVLKDRKAVLAVLERLKSTDWQAGDPLPD